MSNSSPFARCSVITCTRAASARIGRRVQRPQRVDEGGPVGHVAGDFVLGEQREEALGRVEVDRLVDRRRPAEREPRAAHARREPARPRAASAGASTLGEPGEPRAPVGGEAGDGLGRRRRAPRSQPALRSSAAVATARRSASARPHHGARSTASHASRSAGCISACVSETRSRIACRSPSASSSTAANGNLRARATRAAGGRDASARARASRCPPRPRRAPRARGRRPPALRRRRRPRCRSSPRIRAARRARQPPARTPPRLARDRCAAQARAEIRALTHSTRPACERKLRRRTRFSTGSSPIRAVLLRLDEEPHLGAAEAVDRLHRIADGEQRAPVAALPAGGQPADQLELRERRVLEFVDQQVLELKSSRSSRSVGASSVPSASSAASVACVKSIAPASRKVSVSCAAACGRTASSASTIAQRRRRTGAAAGGAPCAAPRRAPARPRARRAGPSCRACAARRSAAPSPFADGGKAALRPDRFPEPGIAGDEQPVGERAPARLRGDRRAAGDPRAPHRPQDAPPCPPLPPTRRGLPPHSARIGERGEQAARERASPLRRARRRSRPQGPLRVHPQRAAIGSDDDGQPLIALGQHAGEQRDDAVRVVVEVREQAPPGRVVSGAPRQAPCARPRAYSGSARSS